MDGFEIQADIFIDISPILYPASSSQSTEQNPELLSGLTLMCKILSTGPVT